MSISKTLFGTTRLVPETGEPFSEADVWGDEVTGILTDLIDAVDATIVQDGSNFFVRPSVASSTLAASATLTPTASVHRVQGNGGAVTLSTGTAIANGAEDGQTLVLVGAHATNTVSVRHGANTALNGNITLGLDEAITLRWDEATGDWAEESRSN